jgi:hypothetical protein
MCRAGIEISRRKETVLGGGLKVLTRCVHVLGLGIRAVTEHVVFVYPRINVRRIKLIRKRTECWDSGGEIIHQAEPYPVSRNQEPNTKIVMCCVRDCKSVWFKSTSCFRALKAPVMAAMSGGPKST